MVFTIAAVGACAGAVLTALLIYNHRAPSLGLWPPSPWGTWQNILFWSLFRTLNVAALALAAIEWQPIHLDDHFRFAVAAVCAASGAAYLASCVHLGLVNLYGGKAGLTTDGLYTWSRNPQYAAAMVAYVLLLIVVQSWALAVLTALLISVFVLMAVNEEPWLEQAYGGSYLDYRHQVSRFYNVKRAFALLAGFLHAPAAARRAGATPSRRAVTRLKPDSA